MRATDDLDALAHVGRQFGRIAGDHAYGFVVVQQPGKHLAADVTRGCGDDDHGHNSFDTLGLETLGWEIQRTVSKLYRTVYLKARAGHMARRGDTLREHILDMAKEAFLDAGFERTSMDAVAARAETSKRSLYAHFPTKEALFLAVIDHVDELFSDRMLTPEQYSDDPVEAAALYCARFLQLLSWDSVVRTCRLAIDAATNFPDASRQLHQVFFAATVERLSAHLETRCKLGRGRARAVAGDLLGATVYPALPDLLFGVLEPRPDLPAPERLAKDVDVKAVRRATEALLAGEIG